MVIHIGNWAFDLNIAETMSYSVKILQEHCQCGYCRNFYASIDFAYPELWPFLAQFGTNVETPEELMPFEPTVCTASYCISGIVLRRDTQPIEIGNIVFSVDGQDEMDYDTECPRPYFVLTTGFLELPWVLEEDMNEVISPANEPEYLQRMWDKLLLQADENSINS